LSIFIIQSQKTVIFVVTAMKTPDVKLIPMVSKRQRILVMFMKQYIVLNNSTPICLYCCILSHSTVPVVSLDYKVFIAFTGILLYSLNSSVF